MRRVRIHRPGFTDVDAVYRSYVGKRLPPPGKRGSIPVRIADVLEFESQLTHRITQAVRAAAKLAAESD